MRRVGAAPFALLSNSRKTECGAIGSWIDSGCAPHPLRYFGDSRKTECGAIGSGFRGARRTLCATGDGSSVVLSASMVN